MAKPGKHTVARVVSFSETVNEQLKAISQADGTRDSVTLANLVIRDYARREVRRKRLERKLNTADK